MTMSDGGLRRRIHEALPFGVSHGFESCCLAIRVVGISHTLSIFITAFFHLLARLIPASEVAMLEAFTELELLALLLAISNKNGVSRSIEPAI